LPSNRVTEKPRNYSGVLEREKAANAIRSVANKQARQCLSHAH
jgi:hypothetical protein